MLTTIYMNVGILNFHHGDGVGVGSPQGNEGTPKMGNCFPNPIHK
jgi:hypothetical protein